MTTAPRNAAADLPVPPPGVDPSADEALELGALIAASSQVLPWLQDWARRALVAFAEHGWDASPSAVEDEMTLGIDASERSWTLGADFWDLASEQSYRLTLEMNIGVVPETAGRTRILIRVSGGPRDKAGLLPVLAQEELLCCTSRPGPTSPAKERTLGGWAAHVHLTLQRWSENEARQGDPDLRAFAREFDLDMQM